MNNYFKSIEEARDFLENKKIYQKDLTVNKKDNDILYANNHIYVVNNDRTSKYVLSDTARTQLLNKSKIPVQFADKIPQDLLNTNINKLFPEKNLVFRTESDRIRGIVTERYKPINHLEFLDGIEKLAQNGHRLDKLYVTDDFMRWSILSDKETGREVGQVVQTGWDGINGETGLHPSARNLFSVKLACLNGMVSTDQSFCYSTRHIKDKYQVLNDYFTIDPGAHEKIMLQYKRATESFKTDTLTNSIKFFMKKWLSDEHMEDFLDRRRDNGTPTVTRMDLIDNLTDYAKVHDEYTRREIEQFAGSII